jgi:hypothetical protein
VRATRCLCSAPVEKPNKEDGGPDSDEVKKTADDIANGKTPPRTEGDGCYAYRSSYEDSHHLPLAVSRNLTGAKISLGPALRAVMAGGDPPNERSSAMRVPEAVGERLAARHFPPHLINRLVPSEPDMDRLPQEPVPGPRQKGDLGDQSRLNPMNSRNLKRRSEARLAGRRSAERRSLPRQGLKPPSQVRKHLVRHSRTNAPGIDEPSVVAVVAEQEGAEMWPRSFRVRPADDNELLPVEPF